MQAIHKSPPRALLSRGNRQRQQSPLLVIVALAIVAGAGREVARASTNVQSVSTRGRNPIGDAQAKQDIRNYALQCNAGGDVLVLEERVTSTKTEGDVEVVQLRVLAQDGVQRVCWPSPFGSLRAQADAGRLTFGASTPAMLADGRYQACPIRNAEGWIVCALDFGVIATMTGHELSVRSVFRCDTDGSSAIALTGAFADANGDSILIEQARIDSAGAVMTLERLRVSGLRGSSPELSVAAQMQLEAKLLFGDRAVLSGVCGDAEHSQSLVVLHANDAKLTRPETAVLLWIDWELTQSRLLESHVDLRRVVSAAFLGEDVAFGASDGRIALGTLALVESSLEYVDSFHISSELREIHLQPERLLAIPASRHPMTLILYR